MSRRVGGEEGQHEAFTMAVSDDLRRIREVAKLPQSAVAEEMGWYGRAAACKIENGRVNISLWTYLGMMRLYRDKFPNHPAHALIDYIEAAMAAGNEKKAA